MTSSRALPPRYYRVEEVAHILAVSTRTVYRMIEDGKLPAVRVRRSIRIRCEDLERLDQALPASGDPDEEALS